MLKYLLGLSFCAATIAIAQPFNPRVPGPVVISQPGTGSGTVDSNTVYEIALIAAESVGGATNGITQVTASAMMADGTNTFAGNGWGLTNQNTEAFWTNLVSMTPQNMNLERLKTVSSLIASNKPFRLLFFGDDSIHTDLGIYYALTNWQRFNGSITANGSVTGIGTLWYIAQSSGVTYKAPVGGVDQLWPGPALFLTDGATGTNGSATGLQGIRTTEISLLGFQGNGYGTISIFTNAYGSTPAFFRAVNMNNSGAITPFATNWNIPLVTNLVCSFTNAGGTNILVFGVGQRDTNLFGGFSVDLWTGSNVGISEMFRNSLSSNAFRVFLSQYDMFVLTDLGNIYIGNSGSVSDIPGITNLASMVSDNSLNLDIVLPTIHPTTNAGTWYPEAGDWAARQQFIEAGRVFNFAILDTWPLLTPLKRSAELGFFTDASHLTDEGDRYIGGFVTTSLGLNWEQNRSYTNLTLANQFQTSGKANLVGGNSFTGTQNHTGQQSLTGSAFISIAGSFPQVNFIGADSVVVAAGREAARNDIVFSLRSSGSSYARPLYLSQTGGVTYLTSDSYYSDFRVGNSTWSYTGNGYNITNVASLRMTTNSTAVTPNISLYITNSDGTVYRLSAQKL